MYYLKSIKVRDYKGIKSVGLDGLPEGAPWVFLTGENGFGKTVFLQAIASALQPFDNTINDPISESGSNMSTIVELHGGIPAYGIDQSKDGPFKMIRQSNFSFLTCYGAYRLETHTESSQTEKTIEQSGINRLFHVRTFLRNIEFDLIKWELKSDSKKISAKDQLHHTNVLSSTKKLLKDLLDLARLEVDVNTDSVLYVEKDNDGTPLPPVKKEHLGSGYRALLGLVGDLIIRLLKSQPEVTELANLSGIVLIDEIELHLHPKWQKLLPGVLTKYFPKVQFIASTHSPIPILGAPEGSVFLKVDRSEEYGITAERLKTLEQDIKYLLPNTVLTSDIFDLDDIQSIADHSIESVAHEVNYQDYQENKKIREELNKVDLAIFPEDLFVKK